MKNIPLIILFAYMFAGISLAAHTQNPSGRTSSEIKLAMHKLKVLGSVLYVAAHPDDENTRLIAYFSKDRLYRTGYLSLTRGDGGQNLIGDEQGIELGLIRTQELLAARRIDGGEQFFSRAFDFGYSKTPDETFSKWNKERILSDVVWVIRKFQPDIIVTRFPTTGEGGHGHHTASAILANEAFQAAADPNRFPEQLKHVSTWQAKRILWNTFNFGGNNTITPDQFRVDVGGYNALLGKSYGEISAESRSQHKSQGFGVASSRGESFESFKTTGGSEPKQDLMDGVDLTWNRVSGGNAVSKKIDDLIRQFDLQQPEKSVPALVSLYREIEKLQPGTWKTQKLKEVKELIRQCSGLFVDVTSGNQFAVQTDSLRLGFSFNNRLGADIVLEKVSINGFDSTLNTPLRKNRNLNFNHTLFIPADKPLTQPYWLRNKMNEGSFNVDDPLQIGQPDVDAAFETKITLKIQGVSFQFTQPVRYRYTDPVRGEVYQPVAVIPPVTMRISPEINVRLSGAEYQKMYTSHKNGNRVLVSTGFEKTHATDTLVLEKNQVVTTYTVVDRTGNDSDPSAEKNEEHYVYEKIDTFYNAVSKQPMQEMIHFGYDHIPAITYFKPATVTVKNYNFKKAGQKIGYITGAGDRVPEALEQMGFEVTLLSEKELSRNNLLQFDAIIAGIRAYNTNNWLFKYHNKLMQYVKDGGNYIVQYNTSNFISSIKGQIGPYDFSISRTRVTDENAEVSFLKPDHPVLNYPNRISKEDFKGWVQERSIYHAAELDDRYETILTMGDPGEKKDDGSLIVARYGKGYFTYTGLVFFRQLPAGVTGAYRLLANIIALNSQKAF